MTKLQWIKSQIINGESPSTTASRLNTLQEYDNPVIVAPQTQKPITINDAAALVPPSEAFEIAETKTYDRLLDAFAKGRMDWVQGNIQTLVAGDKMSVQTATALGALMAETIPDPNWTAKIIRTPAQFAGFDAVLLNEVVEASLL